MHQKNIRFENEGHIDGYLYYHDDKTPLIIFCHGLSEDHRSADAYIKALVPLGLSVLSFDFRGSGQSDDPPTGMSVQTEIADLKTIMKEALHFDEIDPNKIILMGCSQGALVASLVSSSTNIHQGLILHYPAFNIPDIIHETFPDKRFIQDFYLKWYHAKASYASDIYDLDAYEEIKNDAHAILLCHGDKDTTVPLDYSKRLNETYANCTFHIIPGAHHGYRYEQFDLVIKHIIHYLQALNIL